MVLWTQEPAFTEPAQHGDWLDPTLGEYLSAAAGDAWEAGPTKSLGRLVQLYASASQITGITTGEDESGAPVAIIEKPSAVAMPKESQMQRIKEAGLEGQVTPDPSYTQEALETVIGWKSDELRRKAIREAAPGYFGPLGIGAEIAVSLIDPISVASAFLPVVPAARAANMLGSAGSALGRAAVRARIGAIEGAAGALAVEPLIYAGQTQSQADYSMADSLANVAFGIVMGSGLHAAGGFIADKFTGRYTHGRANGDAASGELEFPASGLAGADVGADTASPVVSGGGRAVDGGTVSITVPRQRKLKIPGHQDEPYEYALMEAEEIQASHIPEAGFQPNPAYGLDNERRYHAESASQKKVLENASRLDAAFLMESVDANHGAPVVDFSGNVLGGNGRAMSIRYAYEAFPERAAAYRGAIEGRAAEFGLDPEQVRGMRRPVLVRRLSNEYNSATRQGLVSALNDTFTDSKVARAAGKSRGDRLGARTLDALAAGMRDADSLRQFFDAPESRDVVDMLIADGVIRETDRNALINADGMLNPDGKRVVEEALRGRVAGSYEALASLPTPIVGKVDAAIPYLLTAEGVGGKWDVTQVFRDAIDLLSEFQAKGGKDADVFLNQMDMVKGASPSQRYSRAAQVVFHLLRDAKKAEFVTAMQKFAGQAKISADASGLPGVGKTADEAARQFLGFSVDDADMKMRATLGELILRKTDPVESPRENIDLSSEKDSAAIMEIEAGEYDRALENAARLDNKAYAEISDNLEAELADLDLQISLVKQDTEIAERLAACEVGE